MPEQLRLPRGVLAFVLATLAWDVLTLALAWGYVERNPARAAFMWLSSLGWLAALVVWRQRWAWWLAVLLVVVWLASVAWGGRFYPVVDVVDLLFVAALLAPPIRRHVGVLYGSASTRVPCGRGDQLSPRAVSLLISGWLTVWAFIEPTRGRGSLAIVIVSAMIAWLLLALAIRLVIALCAAAGRRWPGLKL